MDSMTVVRVTDHNMFLKRNSCGSSVAAVNISSSSAGPGNCSCSPSLPVEVDGVGNGRVSLPDSSLSTPASEEGEKVDETVDELSQEESSDSSSDGGVKIVEKFNVIAGSETEFLSVIGLWRISIAPSSDFSSEIG